MRKKALTVLCLAGLTAAQVCVAGGNSNYSGSEKYQPPVPDTKLAQVNQNTETTVSTDTTATKAETPADLADKGKLASKEKAKDKKAKKAAATQALPVTLTCDLADYDPETGDFSAEGHVKLVQGLETLLSTKAIGNVKTGDVWLKEGGTLIEPTNTMNGKWAHYNFNTKTGEIKKVGGKSNADFYTAEHATIYPDRIVMDQGGSSTRCPAVKHTPCLSYTAKNIVIYPGQKLIARDVKVYIKGRHVYSRDYYENTFSESTERMMPHIGYSSKANGWYVELFVEKNIGGDGKTKVSTDQNYYSKAGYKPSYAISHDERNFSTRLYFLDWDQDDNDIWLKKQMDWGLYYKPHHFIKNFPVSYNAYITHGLWQYEDSGVRSWHTEKVFALNHDRIHPFHSAKTSLDLGIGRKWVHESYTDENQTTNFYNATLGQQISPKWQIWTGYYRQDLTSSLFDYGQPDMAKEWRNGVRWQPDDRNWVTLVNRYDLGLSKVYDTSIRWDHRFCCWVLGMEYRKKNYDNSSTYYVTYNFLYW
jgi:hypothetical protein